MKRGYWSKQIVIKDDAEPIDNITKFAWEDSDYQEVDVFVEYTPDELERFAEQESLEAQQAADRELLDTAPEALAELGELVANNEITTQEIMEALAELAALVTEGA